MLAAMRSAHTPASWNGGTAAQLLQQHCALEREMQADMAHVKVAPPPYVRVAGSCNQRLVRCDLQLVDLKTWHESASITRCSRVVCCLWQALAAGGWHGKALLPAGPACPPGYRHTAACGSKCLTSPPRTYRWEGQLPRWCTNIEAACQRRPWRGGGSGGGTCCCQRLRDGATMLQQRRNALHHVPTLPSRTKSAPYGVVVARGG